MLNENELSIESLILCLSSFKPLVEGQEPPKLARADYNLIHSFGRQIVRRIGFTDRQYELAKRKIDDYASYFSFVDDLESIKNRLDIPLREIDRSRWIKIITSEGDDKIAVRFTFQKKLISAIENIKRLTTREATFYDNESKIHYFDYSEKLLHCIVTQLKDKAFDIDDLVLEIYNKIENFTEEDCIPGIYNYQIKNIPQAGIDMLEEYLGKPSADNFVFYKDRALKYGIINFSPDITQENLHMLSTLSSNIVTRKNNMIRVTSTKHNLSQLIFSLNELQRFPVLFVVSTDSYYDTIVELNNELVNIIPKEDTCVMFRMDNQGTGSEFNQYIQQEKINNKLDKHTKIVYTLDNKLPKPLLQSGWQPESIVVIGDNKNIPSVRKTLDCYDNDLVIFYEEAESHSTRYFFDRNLETI